ncbi:ATP-binding protein, partial [Sulfurimonas sp. MAG313]|nr:ATP-binding protein [Sulfurimonas sp. MAG313]
NDLFEIIEERTLSGSIIITAQLPIKEWHASTWPPTRINT